jgi:hypothetical protein
MPDTRTIEASMHRKPGRVSFNHHGTGFLLLFVFLGIVTVALTVARPEVSRWISDAAEAEFAISNPAPEDAPNQFARSSGEVRIVKVH